MHEFDARRCEHDIHEAFGLTYASYLVAPRSLLQDMPPEWQHEFVRLMEAFNDAFPGHHAEYAVFMRGDNGRFESDPLRNYRYVHPATLAKARSDER